MLPGGRTILQTQVSDCRALDRQLPKLVTAQVVSEPRNQLGQEGEVESFGGMVCGEHMVQWENLEPRVKRGCWMGFNKSKDLRCKKILTLCILGSAESSIVS